MQRSAIPNNPPAAGAASASTMQSKGIQPSSPAAKAPATGEDSSPFVEALDGTRLYWTQWGIGRPILFLSSAGMTTQMWDYQTFAFVDQGYRCIAFDRRGHGRSDRPLDGYDYDTFADDLASVITALDLRELTVIAHSMGTGEIVRYLARHGSARVARIVLIASTTPFLMETEGNPDGIPESVFEALRDSWHKDYPKWITENTAPFFIPETAPAMMQWVVSILMQCPTQIAIECNKAVTTTDFRADLAAISVPALVIHGDRDVSAPLALTGKRTAELLPGCRFKVYHGAPHGLMYTHTEMLNADILQFIRET
jgi:non-heme chloroperoxidase